MIKRLMGTLILVFSLLGIQAIDAEAYSNTTGVINPLSTVGQHSQEQKVRDFFKDTPTMIEIARCESRFRQFTDSGNVLRSAGMIGVFQFYESIHAPGAKALGFDLATTDGNLGYAKHLYKTEGTTPWNGSRYCWDVPQTLGTPYKTTTLGATAISLTNRTKLLEQIATLTKVIALLQKRLDAKKFS